jgi:hypothetical protein
LSKDRPTVGISFFLHKREKNTSIWSNGAMQNCVFLLNLLRASQHVGKVYAINAGHEDEEPAPALMFDGLDIEFVKIGDVIDELDLLIEAGAQLGPEPCARVHKNGGKTVAYRFGNAYVIDMERIIFQQGAGSILNGAKFDEVWSSPQHLATNAGPWQTYYRCPVRTVPHIWEPTFVDKAIREIQELGKHDFWYEPSDRPKQISVFEPNINVVKFCEVPILVIEEAYRRRPEAIDHAWILNSLQLKEHLTFVRHIQSLDIQRDQKISFEGRFNTPYWLARGTDVVVTHQWENALNYFYYDVLYGGYPLVHNSPMLPDGVGYRYDGNDTAGGGRLLSYVLRHHDKHADDYNRAAKAFLKTVRATSPENIEAHERAIAEVLA